MAILYSSRCLRHPSSCERPQYRDSTAENIAIYAWDVLKSSHAPSGEATEKDVKTGGEDVEEAAKVLKDIREVMKLKEETSKTTVELVKTTIVGLIVGSVD